MTANSDGRLDWLMGDLADRVAGVEHAVLLTADGLLMAHSTGISTADAEHLSAVGSAFRSLSQGTGRHFGFGTARQTVVELDQAYVLISAAGPSACLALVVAESGDLGLVAYELNHVVAQVGQHLAAEVRHGGHTGPQSAGDPAAVQA
jgi:predicted regulator of Ras-like GTPase activity (Roadblock/LC7/MglB family)